MWLLMFEMFQQYSANMFADCRLQIADVVEIRTITCEHVITKNIFCATRPALCHSFSTQIWVKHNFNWVLGASNTRILVELSFYNDGEHVIF